MCPETSSLVAVPHSSWQRLSMMPSVLSRPTIAAKLEAESLLHIFQSIQKDKTQAGAYILHAVCQTHVEVDSRNEREDLTRAHGGALKVFCRPSVFTSSFASCRL